MRPSDQHLRKDQDTPTQSFEDKKKGIRKRSRATKVDIPDDMGYPECAHSRCELSQDSDRRGGGMVAW